MGSSDSSNRWRELAEASRVVAEAAPHDLEGTLCAVAAQAGRLLRADGVSVHLVDPATGELVRRRPNPLARASAPSAQIGVRSAPDAFAAAALTTGRPCFAGDVQADPRIDPRAKAALPRVVASVAVPLVAHGEALGAVFLDWERPFAATHEDLAVAEALGRHAAVAVRTARQVEQTREALDQLRAILDGADDAATVWAADGRLVLANERSRRTMAAMTGSVLETIDDLHAALERLDPAGVDARRAAFARAVAGEGSESEAVLTLPGGERRRLHVRRTPLRAADGRVWGVLVVLRDITALHDAIVERGRLDGALKTARLVVDRLGNALAAVVANAEVLELSSHGEAKGAAGAVVRGAWAAARTVEELRGIVRFAQTERAGEIVLDLDGARGEPPSRR